MRLDLLERWLKMYPYGYCNGMNFQTCRANENVDCPYCASNVHCSDGNAAVSYYREMLRYMRLKPRQAKKRALMFAATLPSIMRSLDAELTERKRAQKRRATMRLIDADALTADIQTTIEESGCVNHEGEILDCIAYADEIDIVYCADCKHYSEYRTKRNKQVMQFCVRMAKDEMEYHVKPDDFCSHGKRTEVKE